MIWTSCMCREFIVVDTNYIVIGDLRFVDGSLLINVTMFLSFFWLYVPYKESCWVWGVLGR
jgi:hypothetical protein